METHMPISTICMSSPSISLSLSHTYQNPFPKIPLFHYKGFYLFIFYSNLHKMIANFVISSLHLNLNPYLSPHSKVIFWKPPRPHHTHCSSTCVLSFQRAVWHLLLWTRSYFAALFFMPFYPKNLPVCLFALEI